MSQVQEVVAQSKPLNGGLEVNAPYRVAELSERLSDLTGGSHPYLRLYFATSTEEEVVGGWKKLCKLFGKDMNCLGVAPTEEMARVILLRFCVALEKAITREETRQSGVSAGGGILHYRV